MTSKELSEPKIREDLLYYVWGLKKFDHKDLKTNDGQAIEILQSGYRNENSGPDFHQAKIRIGDRIWAGHVEMHVRASDWLRHNHQQDPAFQNIILHVVYHNDQDIELPNGEPLPCLELKTRIAPEVIKTYSKLLNAQTWIPCAANSRPISDLVLHGWYERILVERLMRKTDQIKVQLEATENDWEEVFYRLLARNFGFKVNSDVFERLANELPRKIFDQT